jgi:hypothetical protein
LGIFYLDRTNEIEMLVELGTEGYSGIIVDSNDRDPSTMRIELLEGRAVQARRQMK